MRTYLTLDRRYGHSESCALGYPPRPGLQYTYIKLPLAEIRGFFPVSPKLLYNKHGQEKI